MALHRASMPIGFVVLVALVLAGTIGVGQSRARSGRRLDHGQATSPFVPEAWACDQSPVLIRNARIWSVNGVTDAREIVIADGRIERIVAVGQHPATGVRVVDAAGASLLPGLIDAHVHLDTLPGPLAGVSASREQMLAIAVRQTLASGVTSARVHLADTALGPPLARQARSACFPSPRLSMGGPGLIGGAPAVSARLMRGVADEEHGRRLVRELAGQGFAWVALHDVHKFEPAFLGAIVGEARRSGVRVMAAADTFGDLEIALQNGVESLEYINRTPAPEYPPALLKALAGQRARVVLVPLIGYYVRYRGYRQSPAAVNAAAHGRFYPATLGRQFLAGLEELFQTAADNDIDRSFDTLAPKFAQLRATGVPMAIGFRTEARDLF